MFAGMHLAQRLAVIVSQSLTQPPLTTEVLPAFAFAGLTTLKASPQPHVYQGFSRYSHIDIAAHDDDEQPPSGPPTQGSTVVLVSGGVESAALLAYWTHWDHAQRLLPLFVHYGQRNARQEELAQQAMCRHLGLEFSSVNASMVAHQLGMATAGRRKHDPLPHRNLLLLSLAASFAADSGAANVALCLNRDDLGAYSSATMAFLQKGEALYRTLDPPLQLLTPLIALHKRQVIAMGQQVGAPWHLTYSCAQGQERPCGICTPCRARSAAFEAARVADTLGDDGGGASTRADAAAS